MYQVPSKVIVDRVNKFLAEFKTMIQADYGKESQTYYFKKPIHQAIGNIMRTFKVQDMVLDDENPWNGILASTMFALRTKIYTTTQHTQAQLVF